MREVARKTFSVGAHSRRMEKDDVGCDLVIGEDGI